MSTETDLMILELPTLEDHAVAALHDCLWDLLRQFENHYFHQLRRHQQKLDAMHRDPERPWLRRTAPPEASDPALDDDLNDDIPF